MTLFIYCFYLIFDKVEIIVTIKYSSFTAFFQTVKSLSKTLYLREIESVVWKCKKVTKISSCTKGRCCWNGYYVYKVEYWLWISKALWNLWSSVMRILTLKVYPKFCSPYIKEQELYVLDSFIISDIAIFT